MQVFHCGRCGNVVPFGALECPWCAAALGYDIDTRQLRVLAPTPAPTTFAVVDTGRLVCRCLNAAWGCNWTVGLQSPNGWCRSCELTRGRPDLARPEAVEAWISTESAKRRLIHQLVGLRLPVEPSVVDGDDGLTFDLVHLPGWPQVMGHIAGTITIDLMEADELHRDTERRRLGEPLRTLIGHLRHEIAHYYWPRLIGATRHVATFRDLFGDERGDYPSAMTAYYEDADPVWDPQRHITPYAASHPHEDWAETFAHLLHVLDAVETALAHDLAPDESASLLSTDHWERLNFDQILDAWRPIGRAVNAIAEGLGAPPVYPLEPAGLVIDKLCFVHRCIADGTQEAHLRV